MSRTWGSSVARIAVHWIYAWKMGHLDIGRDPARSAPTRKHTRPFFDRTKVLSSRARRFLRVYQVAIEGKIFRGGLTWVRGWGSSLLRALKNWWGAWVWAQLPSGKAGCKRPEGTCKGKSTPCIGVRESEEQPSLDAGIAQSAVHVQPPHGTNGQLFLLAPQQ